ncbi:MAG: hypothetical protein CM1200mP9_05330 [Gammaproteobacteria bacterium]|nr:MAG: hypothetical protein CM1200mP9_05330 [Gammaproteobacteria bacterium]
MSQIEKRSPSPTVCGQRDLPSVLDNVLGQPSHGSRRGATDRNRPRNGTRVINEVAFTILGEPEAITESFDSLRAAPAKPLWIKPS